MSDIVCTACTVKTAKKAPVYEIYDAHGVPSTVDEVLFHSRESWASVVHYFGSEPPTNIFLTHPRVPGAKFRASIQTVVEENDKVFDGTEKQALKAGWVENEFGWVCKECAGTEFEIGGSADDEEGNTLKAAFVSATSAELVDGEEQLEHSNGKLAAPTEKAKKEKVKKLVEKIVEEEPSIDIEEAE